MCFTKVCRAFIVNVADLLAGRSLQQFKSGFILEQVFGSVYPFFISDESPWPCC